MYDRFNETEQKKNEYENRQITNEGKEKKKKSKRISNRKIKRIELKDINKKNKKEESTKTKQEENDKIEKYREGKGKINKDLKNKKYHKKSMRQSKKEHGKSSRHKIKR